MRNPFFRHIKLRNFFSILMIFLILIYFNVPSVAETNIKPNEPVSLITMVVSGIIVGGIIAGVKYAVIHNPATGIEWTLKGQIAAVLSGIVAGSISVFLFFYSPYAVWTTYGVLQEGVEAILSALLEPHIDEAMQGIAQDSAISYVKVKERLISIKSELVTLIKDEMNKINSNSTIYPHTAQSFIAYADFSDANMICSDGYIDNIGNGTKYNDHYGGSWHLTEPGQSKFTFNFNLETLFKDIELDLIHLTSSSENFPSGGYSPIDITINGQLFVDNYDVAGFHDGSHRFEDDKWEISEYINLGENSITIELQSDPWADTHYWIQTLVVQTIEVNAIDREVTNTQLSLNKYLYMAEESCLFEITMSKKNGSPATGYNVYYGIRTAEGNQVQSGNCNETSPGFYQSLGFYAPLEIGIYKIYGIVGLNDEFSFYTDSLEFQVLSYHNSSLNLTANPNPCPRHSQTTLNANLLDPFGKPIANERIDFTSYIDGSMSGGNVNPGASMTDTNGVAKIYFAPTSGSGNIKASNLTYNLENILYLQVDESGILNIEITISLTEMRENETKNN